MNYIAVQLLKETNKQKKTTEFPVGRRSLQENVNTLFHSSTLLPKKALLTVKEIGLIIQ